MCEVIMLDWYPFPSRLTPDDAIRSRSYAFSIVGSGPGEGDIRSESRGIKIAHDCSAGVYDPSVGEGSVSSSALFGAKNALGSKTAESLVGLRGGASIIAIQWRYNHSKRPSMFTFTVNLNLQCSERSDRS